jgi:hypothetical protein
VRSIAFAERFSPEKGTEVIVHGLLPKNSRDDEATQKVLQSVVEESLTSGETIDGAPSRAQVRRGAEKSVTSGDTNSPR